jgi:hypothetical protein
MNAVELKEPETELTAEQKIEACSAKSKPSEMHKLN